VLDCCHLLLTSFWNCARPQSFAADAAEDRRHPELVGVLLIQPLPLALVEQKPGGTSVHGSMKTVQVLQVVWTAHDSFAQALEAVSEESKAVLVLQSCLCHGKCHPHFYQLQAAFWNDKSGTGRTGKCDSGIVPAQVYEHYCSSIQEHRNAIHRTPLSMLPGVDTAHCRKRGVDGPADSISLLLELRI